MPLYEYKCVWCGFPVQSQERGNRLHTWCVSCDVHTDHKRVFGFALKPIMHEHFNRSVQRPISSMKQYADELKRKSDEESARDGMERRYVPVDLGDTQSLGVTNEGIHESNIERARNGDPLLPEIPS